jgi:hypothetical protein
MTQTTITNTTGTNIPYTTTSPGTGIFGGSGPYINTFTIPNYTIGSTSQSGKIALNGPEADIEINGRSLLGILDKIQSRLSIITDPDPAKLEKYQALKEAYEYYKLMEKLIGE